MDSSPAGSAASSRFLVTIDRDSRRVYSVDPATGGCEVAFELEQRLPRDIEEKLGAESRVWNRGLKTIRGVAGGYVICDIFGVYRLNENFGIEHYLSLPDFTDIHSAIPYGDRLLITNTGVDQALWVDWDGVIQERIDLHRWFPATPWMASDLAVVRAKLGGDLRLMPLDWARESCHLNWAELTPLGLMLSCFIQGEIIFFNDGRPTLRVPGSAKLHAPRYLPATETILFSASEENRIVEVDLKGREVWSMDGFVFAKYADILPSGNMIVADTGNKRITEVDRAKKRVIWECELPGTPYDAQLWPGPGDRLP